MKFRTELTPATHAFSLNPEKPILLVGSCFASNIRSRMEDSLWRAVNPFGTLYNPVSIINVLRLMLLDPKAEVTFRKSLFSSPSGVRSWLFDSGFAAETDSDAVCNFLEKRKVALDAFMAAEALVVTLGTSWVYSTDREGRDFVVSNCHKQPASLFRRRRLEISEIVAVWSDILKELHQLRPGLRVIFTVSPVRHLKDGFEGNMRSKAVLCLAVEKLCGAFDFVSYFPAYEIVNDDLRDYRFYASDLVHPSEECVNYIWEKFRASYLDDKGEALLKEGERLAKACAHRPLPNATRCPSPRMRQAEAERIRKLEEEISLFAGRHTMMVRPEISAAGTSQEICN